MKHTPEYLPSLLDNLLAGITDSIAIFANTTAFIYEFIPNINWVGFYRLVDNQLILGPFQGKSACVYIPLGKGACGTAVLNKQTIVYDDVTQIENYIACHEETRSELVVPIIVHDEVIAVLDIDSLEYGRFLEIDILIFEGLARIVAKHLSALII